MKSALIALAGPILAGVCVMLALSGCDPCSKCPVVAVTVTVTFTPAVTPAVTPTPKPTPAVTTTPAATPTLAPEACLPSSSLGILVQGTNATIYAPLGYWGNDITGINVVPIETSAGIGTGAAPTLVPTSEGVNSCSTNSTTGVAVCVANQTDVYILNGTTLTTTLTSGSTGDAGFTGGDCMNCGVAVDSTTDTAVIALGLDSNMGGGYQTLNLANNTFAPVIPSGSAISEDIAIDPVRHLILSPNEAETSGLSGSFYELVQTQPSTALFENQIVPIPTPTPVGAPTVGLDSDSAAEDCTTGIALSTNEFNSALFITDLTQAKFTPGTPAGTWTAPSQFQNFPEFTTFDAGTCGIAVAPGTHLAVVTGEFGGALEGVIQLPSTSGSGIPAVQDWVAFTMPNDPNGDEWEEGFDPHTVTAYVSPNTNKALGVLENQGPTFLAVVDLQGLLSAPRTGHVVNMPIPAGLVTFIKE
jgi:hypothetical protein